MNLSDTRIGFVGFGNMATAMADGMVLSGDIKPEQIYACAGHFDKLVARVAEKGLNACKDAAEVIDASDVVVIAVKPYMINAVMSPVVDKLADKIVVSVAAGWMNDKMEELFAGIHHVSIMPNTPVAVCEGVILVEEDHTLEADETKLVMQILGTMGSVYSMPTKMFGPAGSVSGCSPAFIAMIIEALGDAAVKYGVPRKTAYQLVSQTLVGTAKLQLATGEHPAAMKDAVCSPGGTTIKGVSALEENGLRHALISAIDAIEG